MTRGGVARGRRDARVTAAAVKVSWLTIAGQDTRTHSASGSGSPASLTLPVHVIADVVCPRQDVGDVAVVELTLLQRVAALVEPARDRPNAHRSVTAANDRQVEHQPDHGRFVFVDRKLLLVLVTTHLDGDRPEAECHFATVPITFDRIRPHGAPHVL